MELLIPNHFGTKIKTKLKNKVFENFYDTTVDFNIFYIKNISFLKEYTAKKQKLFQIVKK